MKNSTNKNHKYTTEKFLNLKSNSARANFIDRAVFLIANSIYLKNHIPSKRSRFNNNNVIQSAGKKTPISHARKYKRMSKNRTKYTTKRTKEYEVWRTDNRKLGANMKRRDTRSRRQT